MHTKGVSLIIYTARTFLLVCDDTFFLPVVVAAIFRLRVSSVRGLFVWSSYCLLLVATGVLSVPVLGRFDSPLSAYK